MVACRLMEPRARAARTAPHTYTLLGAEAMRSSDRATRCLALLLLLFGRGGTTSTGLAATWHLLTYLLTTPTCLLCGRRWYHKHTGPLPRGVSRPGVTEWGPIRDGVFPRGLGFVHNATRWAMFGQYIDYIDLT
jgi:hypothetical protein